MPPARLDPRQLRIGQCMKLVVDGVELEVCKVEQGVLEVRLAGLRRLAAPSQGE